MRLLSAMLLQNCWQGLRSVPHLESSVGGRNVLRIGDHGGLVEDGLSKPRNSPIKAAAERLKLEVKHRCLDKKK